MIRSVPLLEEMRRIVNDEGYIGPKAHTRMTGIAAALAHESWYRWQWKGLRGLAHTRERAHAIEQAGGEKPVDKPAMNYLRRHQIAVPGVSS